jgi:hypothetical protein
VLSVPPALIHVSDSIQQYDANKVFDIPPDHLFACTIYPRLSPDFKEEFVAPSRTLNAEHSDVFMKPIDCNIQSKIFGTFSQNNRHVKN